MAMVTYRIDDKLNAALDQFCDKRGLEQDAVVCEALATWLENAEDLTEIEERRGGPWVEWSDVRKPL